LQNIASKSNAKLCCVLLKTLLNTLAIENGGSDDGKMEAETSMERWEMEISNVFLDQRGA